MRIVKISKIGIDNIRVLIDNMDAYEFDISCDNDIIKNSMYVKINSISRESIVNYIIDNYIIESYSKLSFNYISDSKIYCKVSFYGKRNSYKCFYVSDNFNFKNSNNTYIELHDIRKYIRDTKINLLTNE